MAINISQQPQAIAMSGNALTYTFNSDQTNQTNFYFLVEVYKDSVLHSEHKIYPESGNNGRYDLSQIAELELSKPNIPSSTYVDAQNYAEFMITVKEFYGSTPTEGASVNTYQSLVWKAKRNEFGFNFSSYYPSAFGGNLLTYFNETTLYPNELFYLYALKLPSDPYVLISYRSQGNLETYLHNQGLATRDCLGVNLNYDYLKDAYVNNTNAPVDWGDIPKAVVTITNGTDFYNDYIINFEHSEPCITPTRVHFLNKLGGMESYSFTRPTRESLKSESRTFQTSNSQWFGNFYGIINEDTGNGMFQTNNNRYLDLESGFISESDAKILYDNLFTTPYILIEHEGLLKRVSRESISVSYPIGKLDQLFNVKLKVKIDTFSSFII